MENTEEKETETSSAEARRDEALRKALANPDRMEIMLVVAEDETGCRTVVSIKRHGSPGGLAEATGRCFAQAIMKASEAVAFLAKASGMETGFERVAVR